MAPPDKCPLCGSGKLFAAEFLDGESAGSWLRFPEVEPFPWWKFASPANKDSIRDLLIKNATACLGCGHAWAQFDLPEALDLARNYGSPEMKAKLAAPDDPQR